MITYDYKIDRTLGQGKSQTFVPQHIPTELSDIVLIEGPNSCGKSTLLNIIASGLFGMSNTRINPKLKSKMNALLNSDHQQLRFSVQISENEHLIIRSEKPDSARGEVIVRESLDGGKTFGQPLSPETFSKKYNLIYDIPDNPTERLHELLKELKEDQLQFGNRFRDFYFFLDKMIGQISSARDPKHLEDVRDKLAQARERRKKIDHDLPLLQKFLDQFEKRAYIQYYCYYSNEGEKLTREKEVLEESIKQFRKDGKRITGKLSKDRTKVSNLQKEFTDGYNAVTPLIESSLPKSERQRLRIWKNINAYQTDSDELATTRFEAVHFAETFSAEIERTRKGRSFDEASTWEKVFEALKEFEGSGLIIPEVEVTIGEIVRILRTESRKSFVLVQRYRTLTQIVELLQSLRTRIDELTEAKKQLSQESAESEQLSEGAVDAFTEQSRQLKRMEENLGRMATKCNEYLQRCLSKNIDEKKLERGSYQELTKDTPSDKQIDQYMSLGEQQVMDQIEMLKGEIVEKRGELSGLETVIQQYDKELQGLEKQKPHKFEAHLGQLNELLRKTDTLRQRFLSEYNTNLRDLIEGKVNKDEALRDAGKSRYYGEVSKYLAHRMGVFRHINKMYKAKVVDLISEIIITDDAETIHMIDMGTGQTQSAYILSVLNIDAKNDPRKIIALFDEIAMMDDKSLEPICAKLRELKKQNRLLLGILVQKRNELKIRNLN
jgi:exonuclease SbcC